MTMVREQDAFVVLPVAGDFALSFVNAKRRMPNAKGRMSKAKDEKTNAKDENTNAKFLVAALVGIVTFGFVYSPQAVAYLRLNGHVGPHASVGAKMNWMAPHALQVLFSPEHGFFVWTPLALVAIFGLVASASRRKMRDGGKIPDGRRIFLLFLLMIALQVYVSGSVESWTVAGAFGQRRFVALTAILVIGYAALQRACAGSNARRVALVAVTILGVYWNLALIAEFSTGLMDRQKLEPRRNAYDAFVTIPAEAPSLAYRFLFDRASFYQGARRRAAGDAGGPR
jgi:hypothetical protein